MSKYDDMFARAASSIPSEPGERHATYDRMRSALLTRLRSAVPPIPRAVIDAELAELEAAIQRVESGFGGEEPRRATRAIAGTLRTPWFRRRSVVLAGVGVVAVALVAGMGYAYHAYTGKLRPGGQLARVDARGDPARASESQTADAPLPYIFMRQLVPYRTTYPVGTIIIDKAQLYLYVTQPKVAAVRYGIALGNNCANIAGLYQVTRKVEPVDPALQLGSDTHLIHGTKATRSIGRVLRTGCFQIIQRDFADLFDRVPVGTRVVVN